MELTEEQKWELLEEEMRRQNNGGAAFGIYPSSGKRPEKLNVSRGVNMPAQAARGWVAGTLGLPGDIESLGRMAANFAFGPGGVNVDETPLLPTSEFYQEWLPGGDERPAAKFASGLGALAGGAGSTKLAGAAVKGAKATGKALGPKAAEMAEGYLLKSGLAPTVVKPKGGNWLSGSVERATKPLQGGMVAGQTPAERIPLHEALLQDPTLPPESVETVRRQLDRTRGEDAINNWIDTKLNKYIRNEMGTPEDPVRKLAERDVLHVDPEQVGVNRWKAPNVRQAQGYPKEGLGQSEAAKAWEAASDVSIFSDRAGDISKGHPLEIVEANPWLSKLDPSAKVHELDAPSARGLGFDHLIDELRNATRADSDLPAHLRWKPEDLKKVTMEQAVERVAKINEYRAAKKAEANEALARNPATVPYKDYQTVPGTQEPNSKGLSWKQIKMPEAALPEGYSARHLPEVDMWGIYDPQGGAAGMGATEREAMGLFRRDERKKSVEDALKYEGDVMGHCVGGYCDDVLSGRSQIYSLRDKKGEPHVTIEVKPDIRGWTAEDIRSKFGQEEFLRIKQEIQTEVAGNKTKGFTPEEQEAFEKLWAQKTKEKYGDLPPEIIQIKGKGNAAPKKEYLPFVQDFVRSGNWSRVGDFRNTGMRDMSHTPNLQKWLESKNIPHGRYVTEQEYAKYEAGFLADRLNREGFPGFAKGGLVEDTDTITAKLTSSGMDKDKALTQALRMANAKQEAHMAAGGLAKLLKGAKAAEEAAKAAKPAQIGNYQALPLKLPRAPNLPPQELTKTAERVARQQMGEHVRKSPTEAQNLAGRSVKEAEKLKRLNVELEPTKTVAPSEVVPEKVGQIRMALPGDISIADQMLMSIDHLPIGSKQEGGAKYGLGKQDLSDPRFWASNEGPAQIFQTKVTDLANLYETPEILAQHLAMGHDAMNFAQHFADANLRAIQASNVHPKAAEQFNKIIRDGYETINPKTKQRVKVRFPDFPGIENYEESYRATQSNPEMRKWFNDRMKKETITGALGLPSGKQVEYAIMEPSLRNMEHSMTGLSVGRMKPGASLIPESEHATYSHDIAGQALGHTKELTPLELAFPDASAHILATKRPQDFTPTIQKLFPHQVVDEQYINQLGEYYNRLKQIRGYKKGGAAKKSGLSVLNKAII